MGGVRLAINYKSFNKKMCGYLDRLKHSPVWYIHGNTKLFLIDYSAIILQSAVVSFLSETAMYSSVLDDHR